MRFFYIFIFCFSLLEVSAQSVWTESSIPLSSMRSDDAMYMPNRYFSAELDIKIAKNELSSAVNDLFSSGKHIYFDLPMPNGEIKRFMTYESPVMESGLAKKYPSIKTFKGLSEDGKSIARFGYGPLGFHASIRTPEGEVYVDQVSKSGGQYYVSYFVADHGEPTDSEISYCGADHAEPSRALKEPIGIANRNMGIDLHVYRFALACTGVWGADRGTKELALADMVTSVNRLNQIYENEAAFRLVLIDNNDRLIQLDPNNDGYNNQDEGRSLLQQNTGRINTLLGGNGGYELGHVYTKRCTDVGGVAALGSMCQNNKGAGVTCHYTNLIYITVQVAAHEIGHQLSARHTFNNCSDSEGDNGNASLGNDYEPGSGSTIMSYGGLCGSNNVQGNNDDYYNNASLVEIYLHTREGEAFDCAEKIPTTNIAPVANIPIEGGFYIPRNSYFVLTGEGTDENGDNITYNWEQHDAGNNTCVLGTPLGSCPSFRSFTPKDVPYRFFPREQRILSATGENTEVLPSYKRDLTFALTVRDNNPDAGFADWEYIEFKVDETAGPFKVLSPSIGEKYEVGQNMPVTWDVANTDNDLVNCQFVKIYLSLNKALHESDPDMILLAEGVPNNGEASVILPNIPATNQARILVKAQNSIFFDITDFNFEVQEASSPRPYFSFDKPRDKICLPGSTTLEIETVSLGGYDGNVVFEAYDLPNGITANFSQTSVESGENITVEFDVSNTVKTGSYKWNIRSISDNMDTLFRSFYVDVISTDFSDLTSIGPDEGLKDSPGLPIFSWSKSNNATEYTFQLASNPSFDSGALVYNETIQDTFFETPDFLDKSSVFYWRVKANNECGEGEPTFVRSLGTVNLDCGEFSALGLPVNISASGMPTIISQVNVTSSGQISDINISNISLSHDFFKDLKATLTSPKGTVVNIWSNSCANKYNMNVAFDDDSPRFFDCANGVSIFRPTGTLADFNEEDPKGLWELELTDTQGGNGGSLKNLSLEVCGSIVTNAPFLVKNETLMIQPNNKPRIGISHLLTEDDDNAYDEIIYTLVSNVEYGILLKNGSEMKVGDSFSQLDLNEGRVFYNNISETDFESFYFTVEDGNGGWIPITQFKIEIDEDFPSSTIEADLENEIIIYPNPSSDFFNVSISSKAKKMNSLLILDIHGRLIKQELVREGLQRINTSTLDNGIYLVSITDGTFSIVKKVVIQK